MKPPVKHVETLSRKIYADDLGQFECIRIYKTEEIFQDMEWKFNFLSQLFGMVFFFLFYYDWMGE